MRLARMMLLGNGALDKGVGDYAQASAAASRLFEKSPPRSSAVGMLTRRMPWSSFVRLCLLGREEEELVTVFVEELRDHDGAPTLKPAISYR